MQIKSNPLAVFGRLADDQRITAQRKWKAPLLAPTNQQPCDIGMFSDNAAQTDLIEQLRSK